MCWSNCICSSLFGLVHVFVSVPGLNELVGTISSSLIFSFSICGSGCSCKMIDDALLYLSIILYFVGIRSSSRYDIFIRILFSLMILICILYFLSHSIMLCIFVCLIYDFYVNSILLSHQLCCICFIQTHPIFVANSTILIGTL